MGVGDCAGGGDIGVLPAPPEPVVPAWELGMHCAEALVPLACSHCAIVWYMQFGCAVALLLRQNGEEGVCDRAGDAINRAATTPEEAINVRIA